MNKDKEFLIENLAMLTDSGMDILSALESVKQESQASSTKKFIEKIIEKMEGGASLWKTFEESHFLPESSISLIRIGEMSGELAENLNIVALQSQKDRSLRSKIRSAMMYPVLVLALTLFIGIGIAWFILPRLAMVFKGLKIKLPLISQILIDVGLFLQKYGYIFVPCFLLLMGILIFFLFIYSKTKFIGLRIAFSLPIINKLMMEVEIARFTYFFGTLLNAGIPILEALKSVGEATPLTFYKKIYSYLHESIAEGNSFQKSFMLKKNLNKFIPHVLQQIIVAGERSGNLSIALLKISRSYEEKTEITTKNLTIILEPLMLVIIWLGVMGVALAIILPIYTLIGNLNT